LGLVYRDDAVEAIFKVIEKGKSTYGEAFNIQMKETPTLKEFIDEIGKSIGISNIKYFSQEESSSDSCCQGELEEYYPSVDFGPLDTTKAIKILDFKSTPFTQSLKETSKFFKDAWNKYPEDRPIDDFSEEMVDSLEDLFGD